MTTIGTFHVSEDHDRAGPHGWDDVETVGESRQWSICQRLNRLIPKKKNNSTSTVCQDKLRALVEPQLVNMAVNTTLLIHLVEVEPRQRSLLGNSQKS